jgi:hypothetical protein
MGCGSPSVVKCLSSTRKILGLIPRTVKTKKIKDIQFKNK